MPPGGDCRRAVLLEARRGVTRLGLRGSRELLEGVFGAVRRRLSNLPARCGTDAARTCPVVAFAQLSVLYSGACRWIIDAHERSGLSGERLQGARLHVLHVSAGEGAGAGVRAGGACGGCARGTRAGALRAGGGGAFARPHAGVWRREAMFCHEIGIMYTRSGPWERPDARIEPHERMRPAGLFSRRESKPARGPSHSYYIPDSWQERPTFCLPDWRQAGPLLLSPRLVTSTPHFCLPS